MRAADLAIAVDDALRTRILDGVVAKLTDFYVSPETAKKMTDALRAHERSGRYAALRDGDQLARMLTDDLQAVSHDGHLRVECVPTRVPPDNPDDDDDDKRPAIEPEFRADLERENCGFEKVERLERNVGYLTLNFFGPVEVCGATATAAMSFLAHVDALIIDLRHNGGGDPNMVAWVSSYLFDQRTHLNDLYNRRRNKTTE